MSDSFARELLEQIYNDVYGFGGTVYQKNKADYGNAIQTLSDPLAAQSSATINAQQADEY